MKDPYEVSDAPMDVAGHIDSTSGPSNEAIFLSEQIRLLKQPKAEHSAGSQPTPEGYNPENGCDWKQEEDDGGFEGLGSLFG